MKLSPMFKTVSMAALLSTTMLAGCGVSEDKSTADAKAQKDSQGVVQIDNNTPCVVAEYTRGWLANKYDFDNELLSTHNSHDGKVIPFNQLSPKGQEHVEKIRQLLPAHCK